MVMLIVLVPLTPGMPIKPASMLSHPGMAVGVEVGVEVSVGVIVSVGVKVIVGVEVTVGVSVSVLVGKGVNVSTLPGRVAVGVADSTTSTGVLVGVTVSDGITTLVGVLDGPETEVGTPTSPPSTSTYPRMVRALEEVMVRESIGSKLIQAVYVVLTVTFMRSGSLPVFIITAGSRSPSQVSNGEFPGP